jgi:hypothetical protein
MTTQSFNKKSRLKLEAAHMETVHTVNSAGWQEVIRDTESI